MTAPKPRILVADERAQRAHRGEAYLKAAVALKRPDSCYRPGSAFVLFAFAPKGRGIDAENHRRVFERRCARYNPHDVFLLDSIEGEIAAQLRRGGFGRRCNMHRKGF